MNSDGDEYFPFLCKRIDDLVTMDAAPGWNVAGDTRVGAGHREQVTIFKGVDLVLGANHRHRAEKSASIDLVIRHASSRGLL